VTFGLSGAFTSAGFPASAGGGAGASFAAAARSSFFSSAFSFWNSLSNSSEWKARSNFSSGSRQMRTSAPPRGYSGSRRLAVKYRSLPSGDQKGSASVTPVFVRLIVFPSAKLWMRMSCSKLRKAVKAT